MKKLTCILLALLLVFSFGACSKKSPEDVVKSTFDDLINAEEEAIATYFDSEVANMNQEEMQLLSQYFFPKMTYNVLESTIDGETAIVKAEITTVDLYVVMNNLFVKAFSFAFTPEAATMTQEQIDQVMVNFFAEELKVESPAMMTFTVDIPLAMVDGEWQIQESDALTNALCGGLIQWSKDMDF